MTTSELDSATARTPQANRGLTIGLCTAVVAIAFESISIATAMPAAATELDGLGLYAWAFSLFMIGQLFATVAAGRLADRIGPAKPMALGLVVFSIGLVVAGTAHSMAQLIGGRLLQGLGSGLLAIATYVVIAQVFSEKDRPRMFTYISTAWVLPSFVGPTVSAWLTHHLGWRAVFWSVLPLVAIGAIMMLPKVIRVANAPAHAEGESVAKPAGLWAAGLAAIGAAAIQLAGQELRWLSIPLAVVGLALVGLSLPNLMPRGFFRFGVGLAPVIVVRGLMAGTFFGAEAFVPLMLVEQRSLSLLLAGSALTIGALGWTTGSFVQSHPSLRLRRDRIITLGAASLLVGVGLTALVAWLQLWVGFVGFAWVFSGLGMGLAMSSTSVATMGLSAAGEQGRNAASLQFSEAFAGGLFVGIGGSIFATLHPSGNLTLTFGAVLAAMAVVALVAFLVSLRIGPIANSSASPS
ncbi:MAG: MFS transporter [Propionibacteriaceae bacterium]